MPDNIAPSSSTVTSPPPEVNLLLALGKGFTVMATAEHFAMNRLPNSTGTLLYTNTTAFLYYMNRLLNSIATLLLLYVQLFSYVTSHIYT